MNLNELRQFARNDLVMVDGIVYPGHLVGIDPFPNRLSPTDLIEFTEPIAIVQFNRIEFPADIWASTMSVDRPLYGSSTIIKGNGPCVTRCIEVSKILSIRPFVEGRRQSAPVVKTPTEIVPPDEEILLNSLWRSRRGTGVEQFKVINISGDLLRIQSMSDLKFFRNTPPKALRRSYEFISNVA